MVPSLLRPAMVDGAARAKGLALRPGWRQIGIVRQPRRRRLFLKAYEESRAVRSSTRRKNALAWFTEVYPPLAAASFPGAAFSFVHMVIRRLALRIYQAQRFKTVCYEPFRK